MHTFAQSDQKRHAPSREQSKTNNGGSGTQSNVAGTSTLQAVAVAANQSPRMRSQTELAQSLNRRADVVSQVNTSTMLQAKNARNQVPHANLTPPIQLKKRRRAKRKAAIGAAGLGAVGMVGGGIAMGLGATALGAGLLIGGGVLAVGGLGYLGYRSMTRGTAPERLSRANDRGKARKARARQQTGRYDTSAGPVSVSGINRQRISQGRKDDYGGHTYGGMPSYRAVAGNFPDEGAQAIYDPDADVSGFDDQESLSTALAISLSNVSEEDKAPGYGKFVRALARRRTAKGTSVPDPLDADVNPASTRGGAQKARDLMEGNTPLNDDQEAAVLGYLSESSDEEDDYAWEREKLLRRKSQ